MDENGFGKLDDNGELLLERSPSVMKPISAYKLHPNEIIKSSVDDAINTGHVLNEEFLEEQPSEVIFRCFATIAEPIITKHSSELLISEIRECNDFDQILEVYAKKEVYNFGSDKIKKSAFKALNTINSRLTDHVNMFLRNNMFSDLRIDSFVSDIVELKEMIKNMERVEYEAFNIFEDTVMSSIITSISNQNIDEMRNNLDIYDNINCSYLCSSISITYMNLTAKELFLPINKDAFYNIDPNTDPTLFEIVASLKDHKLMMVTPTLTDILVTKDNIAFKIYGNVINRNTYVMERIIS
jgi:hypothetical protein